MAQGPSARILCVEDNPDICGYICEMMKIAGYETVTAPNLIEGLRLAKSERFDLYLLDYNLPDGTGMELCRLIRALDKRTPILFYSSVTGPELRQEALEAGAQGYISKMEAFEILEQTIARLIESGRARGNASRINASANASVNASMTQGAIGSSLSQREFDQFVERYNSDFRILLMRASSGQYDCLLTSFYVLKDLYSAIIKLHEVARLELNQIPNPISLRARDDLRSTFGFNEKEIGSIDNFLRFVKETQGREFEEILEEGLPIPCRKKEDLARPFA